MVDEKESKAKRFGTIAIEKGYIVQEQLMDALKIQVEEDVKEGSHRLLDIILFEQKNLDAVQIKSILDQMLKVGTAMV